MHDEWKNRKKKANNKSVLSFNHKILCVELDSHHQSDE